MKKTILILITMIFTACFLSACGSSKQRIVEAQTKYKELIELHNQVVDEYKEIRDNSLDEELKDIAGEIEKLREYNLYEMTGEEISTLVEVMNTLEEAYTGYLGSIEQIKAREDAAVLIDRSFSLINETERMVDSLSLCQQGQEFDADVLETFGGFGQGREIFGLTVYFNTQNTPWVLRVELGAAEEEDAEEHKEYIVDITPELLKESGMTLVLKYDEELDKIRLEEK